MENQRTKRSIEFPTVKRHNYFTQEDKRILMNFFALKSHPNLIDIIQLAQLLNKDEKKIKQWFAGKRYLSKENFNQKDN